MVLCLSRQLQIMDLHDQMESKKFKNLVRIRVKKPIGYLGQQADALILISFFCNRFFFLFDENENNMLYLWLVWSKIFWFCVVVIIDNCCLFKTPFLGFRWWGNWTWRCCWRVYLKHKNVDIQKYRVKSYIWKELFLVHIRSLKKQVQSFKLKQKIYFCFLCKY